MPPTRIGPIDDSSREQQRAELGSLAARYAAMTAMRASRISDAARSDVPRPVRAPDPQSHAAPQRPRAGSTFDTYA